MAAIVIDGQRVAERLTGLYRTLGAASVASHA